MPFLPACRVRQVSGMLFFVNVGNLTGSSGHFVFLLQHEMKHNVSAIGSLIRLRWK